MLFLPVFCPCGPSLQLTRIAAQFRSFADYNLDGGDSGSVGRNNYNAAISAHDMRETYLAGFKAVAPEIQGFMCSVNAVNGTYTYSNTIDRPS